MRIRRWTTFIRLSASQSGVSHGAGAEAADTKGDTVVRGCREGEFFCWQRWKSPSGLSLRARNFVTFLKTPAVAVGGGSCSI